MTWMEKVSKHLSVIIFVQKYSIKIVTIVFIHIYEILHLKT